MGSSIHFSWTDPFPILGVSGVLFFIFILFQIDIPVSNPEYLKRQVWANSVDPDQSAPEWAVHSASFGHVSV